MARELNQREKRMLQIGAVSVVAILVFTYGSKGLDRWSDGRASLTAAKRKLREVETDKARLAGLLALVPAFEAPETLEKQTTLFREKLYEQLKKAGIKTEPSPPILGKKMAVSGVNYRVLKIKCKAKCKFDQLLDFLAGLKENPYAVGVEELRIQCDTKEPPEKRKDKPMDVDLVVSTFIRETAAKATERKTVQSADASNR